MAKEKAKLLNIIDSLKGDKVVWMIFFLLMLISVVTIFSSTSTMAKGDTTRVDILVDQMKTIAMGLAAAILVYNIKSMKVLRTLARFGFLGSMLLLGLLLSHETFLPIKAGTINGAWRVLKIGGFQVHIYEIIKVAMIMYLAWAVDSFKQGKLTLGEKLSTLHPKAGWLAKPFVTKFIYIYFPMALVAVCMLPGSGSSAVFTGMVMFVTVLIGGLNIRDLILPIVLVIGLAGGFLALNHASGYRFLDRQATWESRISGSDDAIQQFKSARKNSPEYYEALGKFQQPYSAKIAVKQGGLAGKGPGKSTQRYKVAVMYEDFMYSFIIEEYGLMGGLVVMILYLSLLSRGSIIARNCEDSFGKITIAGLVLLISGQAFLHMLVNVDLGPMTGQTLPLVSHGTSAFLVFSAAFGLILSISRSSVKGVASEAKAEGSIMQNINTQEASKDPVKSELDDLEAITEQFIEE